MINESLVKPIEQLYNSNEHNRELLKRLFKALVKHGFSINKLKDKDIKTMSGRQSMGYGGSVGDKYCKIWVRPDGLIAFCTWANTMIDNNFNWNRSATNREERRIYKDIIGMPDSISAYTKSNSYVYYEKNIAYVLLLPFAQMGNLDFIQKQRQLHILDKNNEVDVEKVKKLASSMSTTKLLEYIGYEDDFKIIRDTIKYEDKSNISHTEESHKWSDFFNNIARNILIRYVAALMLYTNEQEVYNSVLDRFYKIEFGKLNMQDGIKLENFRGPVGLYSGKMYKGYPTHVGYTIKGVTPLIQIKCDTTWKTLLSIEFASEKDVYNGKPLFNVIVEKQYKHYIPIP